MVELEKPGFDTAAFLATPAWGEESSNWRQRMPSFRREIPRTRFFIFRKAAQRSQLFQPAGKEATITLLSAGDFVGEEALAAMPGLRLATATAITACTALRISRER
jgi:CRP/FNR family cyclic AMP-dependent transcriptional regulator